MKKRGIGHLEVILSFIIFIGAVSFALYFFSPTHTTRMQDSSISYAIDSIERNISSEVVIYSVRVNNLGSRINGDKKFVAVNFSELSSNKNVRVVNDSGAALPSRRDSVANGIVYFNNSLSNWPASSLVRVFVNENYVPYAPVPSIISPNVNTSFYDISSVIRKEVFLENAALNLNRSYWQNYTLLKGLLNLPNREDFGFTIEFSNGDKIISKKEVPNGLDVFSDVKRIEILRNNGEIDSANLVVQIW